MCPYIKVFSGSDSSEGSKDDFSWVNGPTDPRLPSDTVFGSSAVIVEKTFEVRVLLLLDCGLISPT